MTCECEVVWLFHCFSFITCCILFFSYALHLDVLCFSFESLALLHMLNFCALCNYVVLLSTNKILIIIIIRRSSRSIERRFRDRSPSVHLNSRGVMTGGQWLNSGAHYLCLTYRQPISGIHRLYQCTVRAAAAASSLHVCQKRRDGETERRHHS